MLPAIQNALQAAGVADARALLARTLMQDHGGQSEQDRHLRRLFVFMVLEPLGVAVLSAYERAPDEAMSRSVADILGAAASSERVFGYLERAAALAGATGFALGSVTIAVGGRQVATLIKSVLDPVLADLCEVVWQYGCDVLLLSGRPSRLAAVMDTVLAKMPVPPHRLGSQYPFRDASNRIEDPKTTAVVGAALCVQAEGRLRNFVLRNAGRQGIDRSGDAVHDGAATGAGRVPGAAAAAVANGSGEDPGQRVPRGFQARRVGADGRGGGDGGVRPAGSQGGPGADRRAEGRRHRGIAGLFLGVFPQQSAHAGAGFGVLDAGGGGDPRVWRRPIGPRRSRRCGTRRRR